MSYGAHRLHSSNFYLPPVALSASLAYTASYFQQMIWVVRFLCLDEAGNPHVFFTVDIGRMAPGVNDEFMVNGLVQAADRRITLFKVDDGRIVIEHFTDRKRRRFYCTCGWHRLSAAGRTSY